MEIVRTDPYLRCLRRLRKLKATDADITVMEDAIAADPEGGDMIAGAGGLRKVRFGFGGQGKRGGGRTIYYARTRAGVIYLLLAYAKVDQADVTADEKRLLRALVKELNR